MKLGTAKSLFTTIIVLGMSFQGHAAVRMTTGGVQYTSTNDHDVTACLTVKAIGDVDIQEIIMIKGKRYTTTCVGEAFFKKNEYLTSINIPNSVTKIDKNAFRGCYNLSKVIIPDTPCDIDASAFEGCLSISTIRTQSKGGKTDYLLAVIDKSNPYFSKKDVIESEQETEVTQVVRNTTSNPAHSIAENKAEPRLSDEENVDANIPQVKVKNENTFVLVIGNENYKRLAPVPYATNDARVFAAYCEKTLGIPKTNIDVLPDATQGDLRHGINTLVNRLEAFHGEAKAIVYYAGHGIPDEKEKTAYLLPVDGFATDVESGYSLEKLYKTLGETASQQVVVFLDACFSGAKRDGEMLASARGVAIRVKKSTPPGKLLVFSAATGNETAICDKDRHHGVFTYYLLKCLRDHKGNVKFGDLSAYVTDMVRKRSVIINSGKIQTPTVIPSTSMSSDWQEVEINK